MVQAEDLPWAQHCISDVYCSTPIPRPLEIYLIVSEYLLNQQALFRPYHFLQIGEYGSLSYFLNHHTQSNGYRLGRFPKSIHSLICAELDVQGVRYSEVARNQTKNERLFVTIEETKFFCRSAEAIFET
jgi:hypothetical protein